MNPLFIARSLRTEYLKLLKTAFAPRQSELASISTAGLSAPESAAACSETPCLKGFPRIQR